MGSDDSTGLLRLTVAVAVGNVVAVVATTAVFAWAAKRYGGSMAGDEIADAIEAAIKEGVENATEDLSLADLVGIGPTGDGGGGSGLGGLLAGLESPRDEGDDDSGLQDDMELDGSDAFDFDTAGDGDE